MCVFVNCNYLHTNQLHGCDAAATKGPAHLSIPRTGSSPDNKTGESKLAKKHTHQDEDDDYFEVESLPKPDPPPVGDDIDERVLCVDLKRKCGSHDTALRVDQKRALFAVMLESTGRDQSLLTPMVDRIFGFLEEDTHNYEDQYLCETSLFMAALLGCNTNVSVLGGSAQALNALFYLIGYLSKNPVKPNAWTTCVAAALQNSQHNESVAEDKGTATRNAKFILQKVLNRLNALAEMNDTQLSMLLLGFASFKCSHRFSFCFPSPALEAQLDVEHSDSDDDDDSDDSDDADDDTSSEDVECSDTDDDNDSGDSDDADDDTSSEDAELSDSDDHGDSDDKISGDVEFSDSDDGDDDSDDSDDADDDTNSEAVESSGTDDDDDSSDSDDVPELPSRGNMIFRTKDNEAVALSQHDLYGYRVGSWEASLPGGEGMSDLAWWCVKGRGCNDPVWRRYQRQKGLHDFNLMEYSGHIQIVDMPEHLPKEGGCRYYYFGDECPIKDSHIQKLHAKHSITAWSGKPPRAPGKPPVKGRMESEEKFQKRTLTWRLKADLYGRAMGAMLVPWDRRGDCNVHSYEDFVRVLENWKEELEVLRSDRQWRDWIFRDRNVNGMQRHPDPALFPDPRCAARLTLATNLGINLRVSQKMRKIANRWRYQNADRFEDCDEYHERHGSDSKTNAKLDVANALAIAALIDTVKRKKSMITGLDEKATMHIRDISTQMSVLYRGRVSEECCNNVGPTELPTHISSRVDTSWYSKSRTTDIEWARTTLKELLKRKPQDPETDTKSDGVSARDHTVDDTDLCQGLSADQCKAFRHAVNCFDQNKRLRMFVHGGPGTGKSFLAKKIMTAARRRGMVTRFTALSGAAATINNGTTIHYVARLKRFCSWGETPDPNSVKHMHERSRGTRC